MVMEDPQWFPVRFLWIVGDIGMAYGKNCRDVNEASKVRGQGQIPQGKGRGQGQKNFARPRMNCEDEAKARDAVWTINY